MKLKYKLLASLLCAAFVLPSMAEEKKSSVSFFGNYNKPSNGNGSGSLNASYGYLVTPQLEVGVSVSESFSAGSTTTGLGGQAQYYFGAVGKAGSLLPYVKADLLSFSGGAFSYTQYGGYGGLAYAMTESAEAFIEVGALNATINNTTTSSSQVNLGLKYRF